MILPIFVALLFIFSILIGVIGGLTGLGGGVLIIPFLVIVMKVNIFYAVGTSLICVIATSSGAAIANLHKNYVNIKIAIFLTAAAIIGAFVGAFSILLFNPNLLAVIFGGVLLTSSYISLRPKRANKIATSHSWALYLGFEDKN